MEQDIDIWSLIESVDIVEYISQFMDLEERASGEYWGVSCLSGHDTDPSFSISPDTQLFYDFSSHKGGNVLDFIKYYNNCNTRTAAWILADYVKDNARDLKPVSHLECAKALKKYIPRTKADKEIKYKDLGDNFMDVYEINPEKVLSWKEEGISDLAMEKFQVRYDPIGNRIVFPIRSVDGTIINIAGRTLDPLYKEHGLRKYTYYFSFGRFDTLYGLYENYENIILEKEIVVFEGAKSVMKAWGWGIQNAVALCTSHMNVYQFIILLKIGVRVVFALDEDVDPSTDENIKRLRKYLPVEFVLNKNNLLGEKMSPVDMGQDVWRKLYDARVAFR